MDLYNQKTSRNIQLPTETQKIITTALNCALEDIKGVTLLKKGMTNHSFVFECKDRRYIIRVPGEGTGNLVNRYHESEVYRVIKDKMICDDPVYLNPKNGYKITRFIEKARTCDPKNQEDLKYCMEKLRGFHQLQLRVGHEFDVFETINYYEKLRNGDSIYADYEQIKKEVFSLRSFIEENVDVKCLSHIDSVPDNFLFDDSRQDELHLQLTDFEYSGMQDPHIDIAMFCIYSMYNQKQINALIDLYFENDCSKEIRTKIYCYIAVCGLLWSNWCEYKHTLGIDFEDYALAQYQYAKEYCQIAKKEINAIKSYTK